MNSFLHVTDWHVIYPAWPAYYQGKSEEYKQYSSVNKNLNPDIQDIIPTIIHTLDFYNGLKTFSVQSGIILNFMSEVISERMIKLWTEQTKLYLEHKEMPTIPVIVQVSDLDHTVNKDHLQELIQVPVVLIPYACTTYGKILSGDSKYRDKFNDSSNKRILYISGRLTRDRAVFLFKFLNDSAELLKYSYILPNPNNHQALFERQIKYAHSRLSDEYSLDEIKQWFIDNQRTLDYNIDEMQDNWWRLKTVYGLAGTYGAGHVMPPLIDNERTMDNYEECFIQAITESSFNKLTEKTFRAAAHRMPFIHVDLNKETLEYFQSMGFELYTDAVLNDMNIEQKISFLKDFLNKEHDEAEIKRKVDHNYNNLIRIGEQASKTWCELIGEKQFSELLHYLFLSNCYKHY